MRELCNPGASAQVEGNTELFCLHRILGVSRVPHVVSCNSSLDQPHRGNYDEGILARGPIRDVEIQKGEDLGLLNWRMESTRMHF